MAISLPIWVDHFSPLDSKSRWMTLLTGAVGLGMIFGYIMSAAISSFTDWKWSFYVQIILLTPLAISISFIQSDRIDLSQ
mmetsp:Transcript_107343/g.148422  ORF Transcript_107343/g.148422 Transcript_107343/m.148422 type:complete len:80 (+) Transcript_107343:562-801(+)